MTTSAGISRHAEQAALHKAHFLRAHWLCQQAAPLRNGLSLLVLTYRKWCPARAACRTAVLSSLHLSPAGAAAVSMLGKTIGGH